jgi:hypothetical protein
MAGIRDRDFHLEAVMIDRRCSQKPHALADEELLIRETIASRSVRAAPACWPGKI